MKKRILFTVFAVFFSAYFLYGQQKTTNFNIMKASFIKTFEKDFDILSDTVKPDKDGNSFWLVTLKPKKEGLFIIRHFFEHNDNWGYKYNSNEYEVDVLPKGTERFIAAHGNTFSICLGDSIVVPISMDKNIVSQYFTDTTRFANPHIAFAADAAKRYKKEMEEGFLKVDIQNNVSQLSCMGIKKNAAVFRNLDRASVTYSAFFKVIKEGKFNLIAGEQNIPITILPKNESFKTLCSYISTYSWEDNAGSSGVKDYFLSNITIRVGDILIVPYLFYTDYKGKERPAEDKLKIDKADFFITNEGYENWLGR